MLDCKTVRIFAYSSTREQSNKRSKTRLKTESETGERRYGRVRLARFARVRLLRHTLPISLLILRKKQTVLQSNVQREVLGMKKKSAKVGRAWKISGREKFLDFYWCKFEENKSVPGGGGGGEGVMYRAVQKEKVCSHVTMVAKFLGEFAALFTNTRSLVPSRPRGFQMWLLSKHVNSKVQKRTMKHGNTQNGSKSSLCTDPLPLRKNRTTGPFSDFSWGEGGLYTG